MRIINPKTGEAIITRCTGCQCHEMDMQFGDDSDICQECGCPKNLEGFKIWKRNNLKKVTKPCKKS